MHGGVDLDWVGGAHVEGVTFPARVEVVEYLGDEQLVHVARNDQSLQAKLPV
jgi:hypothetical protein